MIFYPASAERRPANHNDIVPNKTFTSYEEAIKYVCAWGHDSDDAVFVRVNGEWARAWGYDDKGNLLVCEENGFASKAIPLDKLIERQSLSK